MATRQRGSNNRASSSKQPGSAIAANPRSSAQMRAPHLENPREPSARQQRIAISAYLRAAERGFTPGHELEDWLAAERELEACGEIDSAPQRQ